MRRNRAAAGAKTAASSAMDELLERYGCGPVRFTGTDDALYERRHLVFDTVMDPAAVGPRERYEAVAHAVRDILSQRWVRTESTYEARNPKRVYYMSMEFLIGRSNQISTAGYEASGTSNLKFMMNGALTIGTRDGATIEMAQEAGEENFFLFGLTADQVAGSRSWYNPHWHYDHEPETRAALDLIFSDHFSRDEPGVFAPLRDALLTHGDHYMHLADLRAYLEADQRLVTLYTDPEGWAQKAILNVAGSGKFSSDRTIAEYAAEIGDAKPCPVR